MVFFHLLELSYQSMHMKMTLFTVNFKENVVENFPYLRRFDTGHHEISDGQ